MRAIGTGVATSWLRIASAIGPTLIGFMLGKGGVDSVFLMFASVAVLGLVAATRMIQRATCVWSRLRADIGLFAGTSRESVALPNTMGVPISVVTCDVDLAPARQSGYN